MEDMLLILKAISQLSDIATRLGTGVPITQAEKDFLAEAVKLSAAKWDEAAKNNGSVDPV